MAKVEKVSVALTSDMASMMREAVESGEYASASELVREAIREWKQRRVDREQAIADMRRLWHEGLASGPSIAGDTAFDDILAEIDEVAAGHAS